MMKKPKTKRELKWQQGLESIYGPTELKLVFWYTILQLCRDYNDKIGFSLVPYSGFAFLARVARKQRRNTAKLCRTMYTLLSARQQYEQ